MEAAINKQQHNPKLRINSSITAPRVRLVDVDGNHIGIVPISVALSKANEYELDLVEINPGGDPPVCKIMNYGKYVFQLNKQQAEAKKKQKRIETKRLRMRPVIGEGDYQVKLRNLTRFLEDGDKVEVSVRFRFREMAHKEFGLDLLKRIRTDLAEYADVEREPVMQDRQLLIVLVPKKK